MINFTYDYYYKHFQDYHNKTFSIDPFLFFNSFIKGLVLVLISLTSAAVQAGIFSISRMIASRPTGFKKSPRLVDLVGRKSCCRVIDSSQNEAVVGSDEI